LLQNHKNKINIILLIILLFNALPAFPNYLFGGGSTYNWTFMNSNPLGTDFSPQNQISKSNIQNLYQDWIFAIPSSPDVAGLNLTGQGAIAPPLIVNGIVYLLTNYATVYAIDGADGSLIWSYQPTLNRTGLPLGYLIGHMHGINYYRGEIWLQLPDCSVVALDANTGVEKFRITGICADVPGNAGLYATRGTAPVFFGDIMIVGSSVSEGTDAGRGFVAAYSITNGSLLWRWFVTPPAGGDQNWDTDSCQQPCHGNVQPFPGDWGTMGYNGNNTLEGADSSWGQFAVDNTTGMVYLGTGQPSPDWNATLRPGPNLYSDSIIALNATTGKLIWYFQTTPHDLYDFDCGWNVALGTIDAGNRNTDVVFKACKNGYVYALDALTGKLFWYFDPPSILRDNTLNSQYVQTGAYDPTLPWVGYPNSTYYTQCPGVNGGVESDIALAYGNVYVATHNFCSVITPSPVGRFGNNVTGTSGIAYLTQSANTTIYALDQSTGKPVWSFVIPGVPFRGWLTASGGMVFAGSLDGNIYMLDAHSGKLVSKLYVGPSLYEGPVFGSTITGDVIMLQLVSSSSYYQPSSGTPGVLIAYGLKPQTLSPLPFLYAAVAVLAAVSTIALVKLRSLSRKPTSKQ